MTVTRRSGEGRTTTYRVERTADGAIKRTVTDGDGRATMTVIGNDGVITVTRPDGTRVTAGDRARPALRHAGAGHRRG